MATIASAANGNWGTTGTWTGGVVPGIGDTATVNHQVTLDANYSVGGITPGSTGSILAIVNPATGLAANNRLLVGGGNVVFVAKGLGITG